MTSLGRGVPPEIPPFSQEQLARFSEFLTGQTTRDQQSFRTLIANVADLLGEIEGETLLKRLVDRVVQSTGSERGILLLHDGKDLQVHVARDSRGRDLPPEIPISRTVPRNVFLEGKPVFSRVSSDGDVLDITLSVMSMRLRQVMCAPLVVRGRTLGVIYVDSTLRGPSPGVSDLMFFHTQAGLMALAIEHGRLIRHALEARAMEDQLRVAREIQRRLLPEGPLRHAGAEVEGMNVTFEKVGGDYFDYFLLDSDRIGFAVGDVSGHGIGPALIMSNVRAHVRSLLSSRRSLSGLYGLLNRALCHDLTEGMFVSLFVGVFDRKQWLLEYQNAGHCPPLLFRPAERSVKSIESNAPALGLIDDMSAGPCPSVRVQPGDVLLCFTDGVTERRAADGSLFGDERLEEVLRGSASADSRPGAVLQSIHRANDAFAEGLPPGDDVTLLAARWAG
jgi:serine phosphatase RsbU (regulator of sigma subunit)